MVHYKQLKNGIKLVVKQMLGLQSVTMGILVGTGAAVETDEENGISHYIEHMMFKGTQKRSAFAISDEMDRIGAQMNAFTSKDATCYYAKCITDHAERAFAILADLFLNSTFPEEESEREKGVIIEEISMTEDTPDDLCLDLLSAAYYGERGYGRNILGTPQNVRAFTKKQAFDYIAERYNANNIVISMAGNIDIALAEQLVERYFSNVKPASKPPRKVEVNLQGQSLVRNKDIEQMHIALAYPSVKRYHELFDATQIMNSVLGGSMSSRLFQTVREKLGLAYTVYSYLSTYENSGALVVYAGVNAKNYMRSLEAITGCIADICKKNLSEEEFMRGKEQMLSSQIFAQESTSSQMLLYGKELLYRGTLYNFEERVKQIRGVTLNDVFSAIEVNFSGKTASAVVGATDKPLPPL